jgi:hypothetical protein
MLSPAMAGRVRGHLWDGSGRGPSRKAWPRSSISTRTGGARLGTTLEAPEPSGPPPPEAPERPRRRPLNGKTLLRRPWRLLFLVVLVGAIVGIVLLSRSVAVDHKVELAIRATEGRAAVSLDAQANAMSPGCGCLDPSFGAHPWYGFGLPSTSFDLDVLTQGVSGIDPRRWALTALAPGLEPIDWYGGPDHTLDMRVRVRRGGHAQLAFAGRVEFMLMLARGVVTVDHGARFPYAAVMPGAGGLTQFASARGSREEFGSAMRIVSSVPARPSDDVIFHKRPTVAQLQRGPMIDVLGPRIVFTTDHVRDLDLYAGLERLPRLRDADEVEVTLRTPFALRLIPHPAPRRWLGDLPAAWRMIVARDRREQRPGLRRRLRRGPRIEGRWITADPLPAFAIRMDDLAVPEDRTWRRFARFSGRDGSVASMLSASRWDAFETTIYQTPPVTNLRQVGVFGRVTRYASSAVRGHMTDGSTSTPIARGQRLSVESDPGLRAGRYSLTPLVSAGPPTAASVIDGRAKVRLDGAPLTRLPVLPWIVGVLGTALFGLVVTAIVRWMLSEEPPARR